MSESTTQAPVSVALFAEQIDAIQPALPWALAVSGGGDSVALMHLAAQLAAKDGKVAPLVLTVDHGLRDSSGAEAAQVKAWATALGLEHHTLLWNGPRSKSDLQANARRARYALMGDFCIGRKIPSLLLAHTQNDQAETFLLRLARGSGLDGLSGMAPSAELPLQGDLYKSVRLIRPLLQVSRDDLQAFLRGLGQDWIDDPSNADPHFARVKMRHLMPDLAAHGLSPKRLAETAERLFADRLFIADEAAVLARQCLAVNRAGYVTVQGEKLAAAPMALALRVLGTVLRAVGGGDYRPRAVNLKRLYQSMLNDDLSRCRTLAGCQIEKLDAPRQYLVTREWRSLSAKLVTDRQTIRIRPGQEVRWDHRLNLVLTSSAPQEDPALFEGEIRPLGPHGWRTFQDLCLDQGWPLPHVPARARATLPGLWAGDQLISAVPLDKVSLSAGIGEQSAELRFQGRFAPDIQDFPAAV